MELINALEKNINKLLEYGKDPNTLIAIIENGTKKESHIPIGTIGIIIDISITNNIKALLIIVIGGVVHLHEILTRKF